MVHVNWPGHPDYKKKNQKYVSVEKKTGWKYLKKMDPAISRDACKLRQIPYIYIYIYIYRLVPNWSQNERKQSRVVWGESKAVARAESNPN